MRESWVKMKLDLDGFMSILEAPEFISVPMAWLTGSTSKRAEPYVKVESNRISFHPSDPDDEVATYRIEDFDLESKRFIGVKV